jgi:PHD/YefM family antitoxin component YafN of YafNO toxin-antitoxin module
MPLKNNVNRIAVILKNNAPRYVIIDYSYYSTLSTKMIGFYLIF